MTRRIFSVRTNVDVVAAAVGVLFTDMERSQWLQGYVYGLRGGTRRDDFTAAMESGWAVGSESYEAARDHQQKSALGGRVTMQRHPEMNIAKQGGSEGSPEGGPKARPKGGPKGVSEQSSNPVIQESNNPNNHQSNIFPETAPAALDRFDEFWSAYGKKTGKREAQTKWRSMSQADRAAALDGLPGYVAARPDPQFRKDPVRYLRGRCWEDEPVEPTQNGQPVCPHPVGSAEYWDWYAAHPEFLAS